MKYDFTSIETLILVRSSLRKLVKKISQAHYNLVSHTNLEDVQAKLKDFQTFINNFQKTDEYLLLCEYINYIHCPINTSCLYNYSLSIPCFYHSNQTTVSTNISFQMKMLK